MPNVFSIWIIPSEAGKICRIDGNALSSLMSVRLVNGQGIMAAARADVVVQEDGNTMKVMVQVSS